MNILGRFRFKNSFPVVFSCTKKTFSQKTLDGYIGPSTKGLLDSWIKKYEDFVGLTEVREAQAQVLQAESKFEEVQEKRRNTNKDLTVINSKLKNVAVELEKTNRGTDRYLELVTKENAIIKEENEIAEEVRLLEEQVRANFAILSSALRDSHEKERAQGERTKYWSIIGSIIGAAIGITGTTINNYLRMKELRGIVQTSAGTTEDYRKIAIQLCDAVKSQNSKYEDFLGDIRTAIGENNPSSKPIGKYSSTQINDIVELLKNQDVKLTKEIAGVKELLGLKEASLSTSSVIYVGPQMEELLSQTERNLEWKIKLNSLATVTFLYGALALTFPFVLSFFKGS
ncbi:Hypothetical predicted protein [Mytilus galloprovincialis]|uniref:Coiled-coil domain-containing protein 51 n=1 Tax=Mytilus galloprovincialis TaxID=29158 RepID=A0A8B6F284_MYTGA|nr:Hypothetical predicted protein [Mytilus galloprovincialis]